MSSEVASGTSLDRIIVGGFSQGCAIALLVGLVSEYKGRSGGAVGLSGYLPLMSKAKTNLATAEGYGGRKMPWFLAHGSKDRLVPVRYHRL